MMRNSSKIRAEFALPWWCWSVSCWVVRKVDKEMSTIQSNVAKESDYGYLPPEPLQKQTWSKSNNEYHLLWIYRI